MCWKGGLNTGDSMGNKEQVPAGGSFWIMSAGTGFVTPRYCKRYRKTASVPDLDYAKKKTGITRALYEQRRF